MMLASDDVTARAKEEDSSEEEAEDLPEVPTDEPEPVTSGSRDEKRREKSKKKLEKLNAASEKRGIIYISRIPPHMKPAKVKHLLSPYGDIGRLYLAPEDASHRKNRVKKGGNKGKEFTEGWVEFEDKKVAKQVVQMLNGRRMDPKRRSAFHEDLWSIKYLAKFKWHHLTEDIAYQNAIREQKMAFEISNAKRERDFYLKQVNQSKGIKAMQERKRKRGEEAGGDGQEQADDSGRDPNMQRRDFWQREAKPDHVTGEAPGLSSSTLSMIAGKKGGGNKKQRRRPDDE